ncbi:MAG: hypothetical protein LBS84_11065 [Clostridiales bacterium]|nr:hypothetical protein [Clostridiales bacterium]
MQINEPLAKRGITRYRLAKRAVYRTETLITDAMKNRPAFETFKSNVCHALKDMGDIEFLIDLTKSDSIFGYIEKRWYREGLYLLAIADYLITNKTYNARPRTI